MDCDKELYLTIASSVALLVIKQILAASECKSNSITQLLANLFKCGKLSEKNVNVLTNGLA